ncbi:MAG: class I SAM-dependent methyltransferase [Clostridiales bacterium]|mgnify:CR=1 FL=1|nr:class I SAM-dependent methyltransferase [Clostridiales bacterium]
MERIEALTNHYSTHNEDIRLAPRSGMVEFLTTVHYVEKYLKPGMRILEIGAGTGRYSHYFAQNGYYVDAVELIECNIDVFKANTKEGENIRVQQGDAVNLQDIASDQYDITLLLGPMYHLYTDEDKLSAMSEAIRVTKKYGIVFAAYCNNDITVYHYGFLCGGFKTGEQNHLVDFETFKLSSTPKEIFTLYRQEDINELMSHFNIERLHYVGTDMLTRFIRGAVDEMDDETFEMYMKYHLCVCERCDMVGATGHMLDIFRKEADL